MKERHISLVSLIVKDYDEAIEFYTQKLGFVLLEDKPLTPHKRWVRVAPAPDSHFSLLLAKAKNEEEVSHIGNQTGGRVFLFLNTPDFDEDYKQLKQKGVLFKREVTREEYGKVAVFQDLYGNLWDLLESRT